MRRGIDNNLLAHSGLVCKPTLTVIFVATIQWNHQRGHVVPRNKDIEEGRIFGDEIIVGCKGCDNFEVDRLLVQAAGSDSKENPRKRARKKSKETMFSLDVP